MLKIFIFDIYEKSKSFELTYKCVFKQQTKMPWGAKLAPPPLPGRVNEKVYRDKKINLDEQKLLDRYIGAEAEMLLYLIFFHGWVGEW